MSLKSSIRVLLTCLLLVAVASPMVAQNAEEFGVGTTPAPATAAAPTGSNVAIQSFTGGTEFVIFYGGSTGDVVGFRFTMATDQAVDSLGIWNGDSQASPGLTSSHEVGIWDDTMTLVASTTVTPASPVSGDFRFEAITPVTLTAGTVYTIGAMYTATDDDAYVSGPTITFDPEVTSINAVFPSAGDLGFVFPTNDSPGNPGRIGPNFTFGPPGTGGGGSLEDIPTLGAFGLIALLLGLGGAAVTVLRRRRD